MIRILRNVHRWIGLVLALPLLLQALSGTILALELALPDFASAGAVVGGSRDADAIVGAARTAVPQSLRAARYLPADGPGNAATVQFLPRTGSPRGAAIAVRVDPVTLAVRGAEPVAAGALGWIRTWHTNLLIADAGGRSIVGWLGVGLLLLAIIGVPLWWPPPGRWRAGFSIDAEVTGWHFHRRLHGAVGAWSLVLLVATAATGVVLGFPQTMRGVLGLPETTQPRRDQAAADTPPIDLQRAIALAHAVAPDDRVRMVLLPARTGDPLRVMLVPFARDGVSTMTTVTIDPGVPADTGQMRIRSVQGPQSLSLAETVLRWAHDLHFGQGFGPVWRVLTIATGLILPVFGVTGCAMWLTRRRRNVLRPAVSPAGE